MISVMTAVLLFMQAFAFPSYALEKWPTDCHVLSEGACLMDADSGVLLYTQNADEQYYPASITKVLTALIVIENCDNLSETVTFSYDAVHIEEENSTIIGASEGDKLSVLDCLYCLLFQSANEVANALAEHVGAKHPELKEKGENDRQVFVKLMNTKAQELGCLGSHFNNPSGLTDPEHYTTPYDMCLIMQAAIKNDTFIDIESHTYWKHAPIRRYPDADDPWNTVYMKHMMLRRNSDYYYEGCIAGKTGYTVTAGNTLVTACRRDDMTLVCCVMNAHANHYNDTTRLFDFGFSNFRSVTVADHDTTNEQVQEDFKVSGVPVLDSTTLAIDSDARVTLPKGADISEVTQEFEVLAETEGDTLARVTYYYGTQVCGKADMTLVPLGGMAEVREAGEDPMFAKIAGITEETAAETADGSGEGAAAQAGESPADTENAAAQTGGDTEDTSPAAEGSPEDSLENSPEDASPAAEDSPEDTSQVPENSLSAGTQDEEESGTSAVVIVCVVILAVALLLGAVVFIRYRREVKEEKRRHARRIERMKKVADLSGTQQVNLDLEVRRKMEKGSGASPRRPGRRK